MSDDSLLILAAKRGDVEAFNRLVLRHQDRAFTVAFRILGDVDAAADATQEAFISAFRKIHQCQGEQFRPWLLRIVTNACYDELRRRQRRPASPLEDWQDATSHSAYDLHLHTPQENPEQAAQQRELSAAIQDCLNALPESQRTIAVLSDVEGCAYQDIATATGLALGTVKSRLSRARVRLRDCLQGVRELLPAEFRLYDDEQPRSREIRKSTTRS